MLALETLQAPVLPALHTALAPLLQEISFLGMEGKTPKHLGTADQVPLRRLESGGASHGTRQESRSEAKQWSLLVTLEQPGSTHLRQAKGTGHQRVRDEAGALGGG